MALGMALKTFRKQCTNHSFCSYKRFFSMSPVMKDPKVEHAMVTDERLTEDETKKQEQKNGSLKQKHHKKVFTDQQETTILNFFNHCDHVTLKKFLQQPTKRFKLSDFGECLNQHADETHKTFEDIQAFLERTSISSSYLPTLYDLITKFEVKERRTFGLPSIVPKFPVDAIKNVKYTVALDLFLNGLSWAVMNKNQELVDVGTKQLFEKQYVYHPEQHHEMVQEIMNTVPPSTFYIFCSNIPRNKGNFHGYQTTMEALLKLTLNHKMNLLLKNSKDGHTCNKLRNYVYQVKLSDLGLFYDVLSNQELVDLYPIFQQWQRHNSGPLRGMTTAVDLHDVEITNSLMKCMLLADATCRCLTKQNNQFPAAYFPPGS